MTDDITMERKAFALLQPSKSSVQEQSNRPTRLPQDGSGSSQTSKSYARPTNRRKEPLFGSSHGPYVKTDSVGRKPTAQKSKALDKRPRNRGVDNRETVVCEHEEPEIGSIHAPGGKKQNLNHLLNFHFTPRDTRVFSAGSWHSHNTHPGGNRRSHYSGGSICRPKFNKEQFLQANCQFMVKSTGDYTVYKSDPDLLVEWNSVEQIYIRTIGETPHCPICLSPPVAGKMTRCGHIFCWPCLLHYLALSDKAFRKCPICYEAVHKDDLKSVVSKLCSEVNVGDEVKMQLMCRPKDSLLSMPLMCRNGAAIEWETVFSKLLDVTPSEVLEKVIAREARELNILLDEDRDCPEACFIEQALEELEVRRGGIVNFSLNSRAAEVVASSLGMNPHSWTPVMEQGTANKKKATTVVEPSEHSCVPSEFHGGNVSEDDSLTLKGFDLDEYYMFYQAMDGQPIFLHPLNMAMLWKGFGEDPTMWPQIIQFRVVEKESVTMTDDIKKRLKFLRHLPITTSFHLVEVEIKPPMVSETVLTEFQSQLDSRKKRRAHRAREERRRERLREAEERNRMHKIPCPKINSKLDFPDCGKNEDFEGYEEMLQASLIESNGFVDDMNRYLERELVYEVDTSRKGVPITDEKASSDMKSGCCELSSSPSVSFAQIVSQKSTVRRSTTYPVPWSNVGAQKATNAKHLDGDADPDDYSTVPEFRNSVSEAIAKAFASVNVNNGNEVKKSGQKKNKKNKGKILFSTGMGGLN